MMSTRAQRIINNTDQKQINKIIQKRKEKQTNKTTHKDMHTTIKIHFENDTESFHPCECSLLCSAINSRPHCLCIKKQNTMKKKYVPFLATVDTERI